MNMIIMNDDYNGILLDSQGNTSNVIINGDLMFNSRTGEFVNVIRNGYSNIMTDFNGEVYNVQYRKWGKQFIRIQLLGEECSEFINLPWFKPDTMYKGMELNKEYTLEEIGLWIITNRLQKCSI